MKQLVNSSTRLSPSLKLSKQLAHEIEHVADGLLVGNGDAEGGLTGLGIGLDKGLYKLCRSFGRFQGLSKTREERDALGDQFLWLSGGGTMGFRGG